VAGGETILAIVGLLALLIAGCELLVRRRRSAREAELEDLYGYPPAGDVGCPWPRLEPEVESLRQRGAL
jgi:hypothetical protein